MKKNNILRIIHTLNPSLGGPSNAIIDHSKALVNCGFSVDILTSDKKKYLKKKIKNIRIINKGSSLGNYGFNFNIILWLYRNKKKYDLFIVHELWRFYTLLARIILNNYFVFIHGQLDPFFKKNLFKLIKKKIYWYLIEKKNLIKANSILLTTELEKKLIENTYVNTNGIKKNVIKYGIIKKNLKKKKISGLFYKKFKNLRNKKFYLFLGRFHEKKGCEILVKSIFKIKENFSDIILMAGPLTNSNYEKKLFNLINKYKLKDKFIFVDALYGELKWAAIQESKAMVLPSHGENFGVSLIESLSFSKPVLTTFKVNTYKEILNYRAGFVSKNNSHDFSKILKKFSKLKNKNIRIMSDNALKCFNKEFNLLKITKKNFDIFKN